MSSAALLPDSSAQGFWGRLPASWMPYVQLARLDRPVGWQLLLAPCLSATCLAAINHAEKPHFGLLVLFAIGSIAMRGAGSTLNDFIDRDIDAKVERTRGRPLASGQVTPRAVLIFLMAQCLIGLCVLLSLNPYSIVLGFVSLLPVAVYPFMKRITSWPQAVLGLAFSWGALIGWSAVSGELAAPAFWLYGSCILWTIGYDTIYAIMDRKYDVEAGVKSTALLFGEHVVAGVALLYFGAVLLAEIALLSAGAGVVGQLGLVAFGAHLARQVRRLHGDEEAQALQLFRSNALAGFLLFGGLLAENVLFYFV
ncbi:4-hydroxybenzoate polyprenyltransferase [Rhodoblastus sphagnicola]|uniref:4-hydroxybenzoate octaprenyltransferase n=1 Tax=Rhodoblastus sphagnicola TaxID=333368 RepID=A0A2S6N7N6_9HYPH|nr:4-hydroxybenzoate octaprenyltransferase [Rhodoblastus sphagnicola]MBB4196720.1 4-hydroxybenzoate polyprenyltransferase [Rhodoblastus sphagnicola]PPQ30607.1 4-hydroxybenzoate polyprenyltransferase [Rhodoblastus sphagnicola]